MTSKPPLSVDANTLLLQKNGYSDIKVISTTKLSSVYSCLNEEKEKVAVKIDNKSSDLVQLLIMASFQHKGITELKKIKRGGMRVLIETQSGEYDYYGKILLEKHLFTLLDALAALYENNIFHGDIKPSNMVKIQDSIKLIDFNSSSYLTGLNEYKEYRGGTSLYTIPTFKKGQGARLVFDLWALAYSFLLCYVEVKDKDKLTLRRKIEEAKKSSYCTPTIGQFLEYVLLQDKDLPFILTKLKVPRTSYKIKEITLKNKYYDEKNIKSAINSSLLYIYSNFYWNTQPIKWLFDLVALIYYTFNDKDDTFLHGISCAAVISRRYPFNVKRYNPKKLKGGNMAYIISSYLNTPKDFDNHLLDVIVRCQGLVTCNHLYSSCQTEEDYKECFEAFFLPPLYIKGFKPSHIKTDITFLSYLEDYVLQLLK